MSKNRKASNSESTQPVVRPNKVSNGQTFITRRRALFALGAIVVAGGSWTVFLKPTPVMAEEVEVYKDPSCECCGRWVNHMRQNGFSVVVHNVEDMAPIKRKAGIPETMESCHTAFVGGYSVEGHIPADDIKRMLIQRPDIKGLAVPGMPMSAPGMDSPEREPFTVLAFNTEGMVSVFSTY